MTTLDVVIAERVLDDKNGQERVTVRLGAPKRTQHGDFLTPYQIVGAGDGKIRAAAGLDAIQSLQLVFSMIAADLAALPNANSLKWADSEDFGFPTVK